MYPSVGPKSPLELEIAEAIYGVLRPELFIERWVRALEYCLWTQHGYVSRIGVISYSLCGSTHPYVPQNSAKIATGAWSWKLFKPYMEC